MIRFISVKTAEEFINCFNNSDYEKDDLVIDLESDIELTNTSPTIAALSVSSNNKRRICINGNRNIISSIAYTGTPKTGFAYPISRFTTYIEASSRIQKEDGSEVSRTEVSAGTYRVMLNDRDKNITIDDYNYINLSCGWTAYTCEIIKIEDGYCYFKSFGTEYSLDFDWYQNNNNNFVIYKLMRCPKHTGTNIEDHVGRYTLDFASAYFDKLTIVFNKTTIRGGIIGNRINLIMDDCEIFQCSDYGLNLTECNTTITNSIIMDTWKSAICAKRTAYYVKHNQSGKVWYTLIDENDKNLHSYLCCNNTYFNYCVQGRSNVGCIHTDGYYNITNNIFKEFGAYGVFLGISNMPFDWDGSEEILNANHFLSTENQGINIDTGCIYIAPNNKNCIISNNIIETYVGRKNNQGIYLDDGAYNVTVVNNTIEAISGYAISARNAGEIDNRGYGGGINNTFKYIINNFCRFGGIWCGGINNLTKNNCIVKKNLIHELDAEETTFKFKTALSFVKDIDNVIKKIK